MLKKISIADVLVTLLYVVLFLVFFRGFFYPDPLFANSHSFMRIVQLWVVRVVVLLPAVLVWAVYIGLRTGRLKIKDFFLLGTTLAAAFLVFTLAAGYLYFTKLVHKGSMAHSYLQLDPNPYEPDSSASGQGLSIICLGGSTTEFKNSAGFSWPRLAEISLRRAFSRNDISVYNQGRQWYTTLHSLINYETNLRSSKPDVIIIMHVINDLLHNADFSRFSHGAFREDYGNFFGPMAIVIHSETFHSWLWNKFRTIWYHQPRREITVDSFQGLNSFRRNLNTLIDLAQKDSVHVILMTQPSLYQEEYEPEILSHLYMLNNEAVGDTQKWTYQTALNGYLQYNACIRKLAKDRNVTLIDLEPGIPKTLDYFSDDVHYRDAAFELVAKLVTEGIIKTGVISGGVRQGQVPLFP